MNGVHHSPPAVLPSTMEQLQRDYDSLLLRVNNLVTSYSSAIAERDQTITSLKAEVTLLEKRIADLEKREAPEERLRKTMESHAQKIEDLFNSFDPKEIAQRVFKSRLKEIDSAIQALEQRLPKGKK